jgi:MoaA/NifB/PqqE/SkfB family radical SAM enzyme
MGLLYSKFKIFNYKEKLDSLPKEFDVKPPIHIRIKPTNVCAHNCWYCAYRSDNYQLGEDMVLKDQIPQDKMDEIIDDCISMGVKAVTFSGGGDPFYYPNLLRTVKKLSQSDIKFAALTNGVNLKGELAEIFSKHSTWLRISIDGWDDASYAKYRGIKEGEFTKVINNLREFKKLDGDCYLGVSIVVDKDNAPHIYEMLELFHDIGVNSVKVSACLISDDIDEINAYHKPYLEDTKKQIQKAIEDFSEDGFEIQDSYYEITSRYEKNYDWCPYVQINPVIAADMMVYSCHDKAYTQDGILWSIKEQSFKTMWNTNKEKFFNINPKKHCNHHCMVNVQNQYILDYLNIDKNHQEFV